jgi:hypothetical protein
MGAAAGAAFAFYEAFTTKDPTLRAEMSLLAGALIAAAAAQWIMNTAAAFGMSLTVAGIAIVAVAAAAAAATYLLSSSYGAGSGTTTTATQTNTPSTATQSTGTTTSVATSSSGAEMKYPKKHPQGTPITADEASYFEDMDFKFDNDTQTWVYSGNYGYAKGGMSVKPQLAMVSENGEPEYHIPESVMSKLQGGNTYNITQNIDGSKDVDIVASEVARQIKNAGVG